MICDDVCKHVTGDTRPLQFTLLDDLHKQPSVAPSLHRSSPSLQMKLASKGIQEDDTGKVALPIMHFKRIQCFEDASPFPSNVPTRSPSPCQKQPIQNDRPRSRSPDTNKPKLEAKGAQGAQATQGAQSAQMKGVSPVVSPSRQKETEQSKLSKPTPKPVQKAPKSPTPASTSNTKQVQAVQANPAKASAPASAKALPKPGDKQESPSPRSGHLPHSVTVARLPEKRLQPAVPEKQEVSIASGIQDSNIGQRQPSPLGSSSAAPKASQKSPRGVGAGVPSHQKLPASARQADNQPASMKRPITPPTPSRAASAASGENISSSRGAAEVDKPRPQVSATPSSQTMPVAAPATGHRGAPKLQDRQSRLPTPVHQVQPKSSAATPMPSPPVSSGKELHGTGVSPRPPSGRPLATPASSGHQPNGVGKTPSGMQPQGGLPPPKAASSSSSGPVPAQSSSSHPARSSAPAEEDEYENYSVYSGSSHSSSSSHHRHRKHSGSGSSSSQSDGARSRSPSSGRQCGNDFLPDISVQVRAPKNEDEDTSHAPQGRADDLCEFHVMHDDDAAALQGGTSLQQEYDKTLRRLGARRAAASQGLQRQVTHW